MTDSLCRKRKLVDSFISCGKLIHVRKDTHFTRRELSHVRKLSYIRKGWKQKHVKEVTDFAKAGYHKLEN